MSENLNGTFVAFAGNSVQLDCDHQENLQVVAGAREVSSPLLVEPGWILLYPWAGSYLPLSLVLFSPFLLHYESVSLTLGIHLYFFDLFFIFIFSSNYNFFIVVFGGGTL
jgi:hypothetical protein